MLLIFITFWDALLYVNPDTCIQDGQRSEIHLAVIAYLLFSHILLVFESKINSQSLARPCILGERHHVVWAGHEFV